MRGGTLGITISVSTLQVGKIGTNNYPMLTFHLSQEDAAQGFMLVVEAAETYVNPVTADVICSFGPEDVLAEVAGNTLYDVNSGAAGSQDAGTVTFDFSAQKKNQITLKAGTTIGATLTMPAVLPPVVTFIFNDASLRINKAYVTKRVHRMGG